MGIAKDMVLFQYKPTHRPILIISYASFIPSAMKNAGADHVYLLLYLVGGGREGK